MTSFQNPPLQNKLKRYSAYLIYFSIAIGALVLLGWLFDLEFLKRPLPHLASMNPATSILFILSGMAFLCFSAANGSKQLKITGYVIIIIVLAVALLRLLDVFAASGTGVDLFIFSEKLTKELTGKFSNRMAPSTAVCFLLAGIAIPLLNYETPGRIMPAHLIAMVMALVALLSVLGCVYGVQPFYMRLAYIPMAMHTAVGFLCIALAILFSNPNKGIMKELTSPLSGSQAARLLIPAAILIPLMLGYLRLLGHWSQAFSVEFGVAILVLSIIVMFVLFVWFNAISLNKKDALRIEAETQLNKSMQRLTESEQKFQKAFQASAAGISITRLSDSTYADVNDAFIRMVGYSKKELIGHSSRELNIVVDMRRREEVLQKVLETGSAQQVEMTMRHSSGALREILTSIETIVLNDEKFAINIIFDITDRRHTEMQLKTANKELEAFTYSVSHDLREPLRAVDGYAKMLEEDYSRVLDKEGLIYLETIQNKAKKMGQLIDDLLDFSRLGRKNIHKGDLNVSEMVSSILSDLRKTYGHNAEIKVTELHPAKGDFTLMRQVFVNLISNGIKYSSKKDNALVEISSELKDDEVIYRIKDNGAGFDMAYAGKLFGVFQRLHSDEEFEGTGVGLAIVQRIINKHGGRIWAEAEPDKGATFIFSLPIK